MPAIGRVPMLRGCSSSVRQRPQRSELYFTSRASLQPPWSCAGCSQALRTLSKRESARGRSLAGDRCPGDYTRRDCASARISPPPALKPTPRRASHRDATEPALPGVGCTLLGGVRRQPRPTGQSFCVLKPIPVPFAPTLARHHLSGAAAASAGRAAASRGFPAASAPFAWPPFSLAPSWPFRPPRASSRWSSDLLI